MLMIRLIGFKSSLRRIEKNEGKKQEEKGAAVIKNQPVREIKRSSMRWDVIYLIYAVVFCSIVCKGVSLN